MLKVMHRREAEENDGKEVVMKRCLRDPSRYPTGTQERRNSSCVWKFVVCECVRLRPERDSSGGNEFESVLTLN